MDKATVRIPDGRKFKLACEIQAQIPKKLKYGFERTDVKRHKIFKYDTGAQFTCLPAKDLGIDISEEDFISYNKGGLAVKGTGIDKSTQITYYLIQVDNFIVADIELGSVPIYITFDLRATKRLLGMDIIRLLNVEINFDKNEAIFHTTEKFRNFKKRKLRLEIRDMFEIGIYSKNDFENDIDWQSMLEEK
ncbi:MAG: hypothetical protein NC429_04745 [Lachnospiraceae bacterium]|nr:hypothetical protein [Lachnospiraceae bacterium]